MQTLTNGTKNRKSSDGKTGLEILMMVIEQGLNPNLDESQRVFSGPLISDLLQKVSNLNENSLIAGGWGTSTNITNATESYDYTTLHCHKTGVYPSTSFLRK